MMVAVYFIHITPAKIQPASCPQYKLDAQDKAQVAVRFSNNEMCLTFHLKGLPSQSLIFYYFIKLVFNGDKGYQAYKLLNTD